MMNIEVIIVGGGLSGLYAARLLEKAGINYLLLECRERMGGRILQANTVEADLGATWFWPTIQPALKQLFRELNIESFSHQERGDMLFERSKDAPSRHPGFVSSPAAARVSGGMSRLPDALLAKLKPERIQTGLQVKHIEQQNGTLNICGSYADGRPFSRQAQHVLLWLVMGGASLYGAFPLAYAVITDALAAPLTLMLIGLIFRGVAFEFRFKATPAHKPFWDKAFISGSILAAFCQGIVVGAVINGLPVSGRAYAGSAFIWLDPFALFCGLGLLIAYALLGSTWLMVKTEGHLQHKMAKLTLPLLLALMVAMGIISLWTPLAHPHIANRWFSLPNLFWFLPVPVLVLFSSWGIVRAVNRCAHYTPFFLTLMLVFLGFSGLGISIWPTIIPPSVSLRQAAAPVMSQSFMLAGSLVIIPVILVYTFWSYYVFRGKVRTDDGYH